MTVKFPNLFKQGKIGELDIKNRVVMPAMGTGMHGGDGEVVQQGIDYYTARARGGTGLIIVEIAAVHPTTKGMSYGIYDDSFIPGLQELAGAIKNNGARACIQLWHAGRQINSAQTGMEIVAPSSIPCPMCHEEPRELAVPEIKELVEAYGNAALRAQKAGFECVEVHGAHGYLIAQFLSPYSNNRNDDYGGTFENRLRFAAEVVQNIKKKCGENFPVIFRISGEEYVDGGLTIESSKRIARELVSHGVDCMHVSVGNYETIHWVVPPMDKDRGFNVWAAAAIKEVVNVPVIAVDRINNPRLAEEVLSRGKADFTAIGRGVLTDPEFANKARDGREKEIKKCIACNQGCVNRLLIEQRHTTCILNPACGREREFQLKPALRRKNIVVAGGGPAGMEAAQTAARRGHRVTLFDVNDRLGGRFRIASYPPKKEEIKEYCEYMEYMLPKAGVDVRYNTRVTPELIARENPDAVIVATGGKPVFPPLQGVERSGVVSAQEVLEQKTEVGGNVVIIGGGSTGLVTADHLAKRGRKVTVLEAGETIGEDEGPARKIFLMERLGKNGADIYTNAAVQAITDRGLEVSFSGSKTELEANSVIMAVGDKPVDELSERLRDMGVPTFVIGDARNVRKATEAIYEGVKLGLEIEKRLEPHLEPGNRIMFGTRIKDNPAIEFGVSPAAH
ncbi:MAG: FAD-dependent oxidoreductase [Clostridiales bacterium]|nr:FAD-dependent oxidoreductase [Clostridiales bacterium]MCF8022871.1 FAD-dependent oxidoreductase [Clostridiales bacterium]